LTPPFLLAFFFFSPLLFDRLVECLSFSFSSLLWFGSACLLKEVLNLRLSKRRLEASTQQQLELEVRLGRVEDSFIPGLLSDKFVSLCFLHYVSFSFLWANAALLVLLCYVCHRAQRHGSIN